MDPANNLVLTYQYGSGVLLADPKMYHVHDYIRQTFNGTENCHYLSRSSTSYVAPGMMNGSNIMYRDVTVLRGTGGEGGKTVKTFSIPQVFSNPYWPYVPTFVASWQGGRVRSSSESTSAGQTLAKRTYRFTSANEKWIMGVVVGARFVSEFVPHQWEYIPNRYTITNGAYLPTGETQQVFDEEGTVTQSHTVSYDYDMLPERVQLTGKTETNSDGTQRITEYTYAHERYGGMRTRHMLTQPYKVTTRDGAGNILKIDWTLWDTFDTTVDGSPDQWQPCARWTGGPELGTARPPECTN